MIFHGYVVYRLSFPIKIVIFHGYVGYILSFPIKMVIFRSSISLPEGSSSGRGC